MRIVESQFVKSAVYPKDYPETVFGEIAFAGRSNVGKSTLINTITNRKLLAKTSGKPGKTRLLNTFLIRVKFPDSEESGFFNICDLPGYGFAKVSLDERDSWRRMISTYFTERYQLKGIALLVDIRRKADPKDILMKDLLVESKIPFCFIATKCDKIKKTIIPKEIARIKREFELTNVEVIPFSSIKKVGINQVTHWIEKLLF
ncbi:YihA family ribosome biogenesis GTP-binding protein [bacterium]|nr:YihA family ribosome biogenesis GTP-binding protein [bacterium]